jgi:phage gp36-like protein
MVTINDFNTHMYPELIDVISRENNTILNEAINAAEGEARGYLSRYDRAALFSATGTDRDSTLLMYLKDMAVWHFIVVANPNTDLEFRKERYDNALAWLKGIQAGKIVPEDWPEPTVEPAEDASFFVVSSRPKRDTNY